MPRGRKRTGAGSKEPPAKRTRGQKAAEDPDGDDDTSADLPLIKIASPTKPKYWKRNFDSTYG